MDDMNIGQCLDYIQKYIDNNAENENGGAKATKATQSDFDAF